MQSEDETKSGFYIDNELVRLNTGSCFGELALINEEKRAATVTTVAETHFAILEKENFMEIMKNLNKEMIYLQDFGRLNLFKNWQYNYIK